MEPDGHDAIVGKDVFDSTAGFSFPFIIISACLFMAFPIKQIDCIYFYSQSDWAYTLVLFLPCSSIE